jgi:HD-GYP domain-containing protein (c-di-GMP phosphodiesterase class II)
MDTLHTPKKNGRFAEKAENLDSFAAESPYPCLRTRRDGTLVSANPAAEKIVRGWKWLPGKICPNRSLQKDIRSAYNAEERLEIEISVQNSTYMLTLKPVSGEGLVDLYGYDLTSRKKTEVAAQLRQARLESWFHILQYKTLNLQIWLDYALDEAIKLTRSKIGYIYFYDEARKEFVLNSWSRKVMEACSITEPRTTYKLEQTGFWGEVVRQSHPIILNDFHAPHPLKKGYPEGHSPLDKFMSIPVYQEGAIVAVVGVANKETDYDETDIQQLQWLMAAVWKVVDEKKIEEAQMRQMQELRQRNEELAQLSLLTERQVQRLTSLHTIDTAMILAGGYHHQTALEILLKQATQHLKIDAAAILGCGPNAQTFEYRVTTGFRLPPPPRVQLALENGCARRAALERRLLIVPDLATEPAAQPELTRLSRESFVTYLCLPLVARGQLQGLLELYHREPYELEPEALEYLEKLIGQAAAAIEGAATFEQLQRSNLDLSLAYDSTLEGWAHAVEVHEHETEGHTRRLANLTVKLAETLGMTKEELVQIYRGALLHDIGMISVPDEILHKSGPLSAEEQESMQKHPQAAYEMLAPIPFLKQALDIPYCHHEKWDGSGYPRGLKGPSIPLAARIFAIVDGWEALVFPNAHRSALPRDQALELIVEQAGKHFDPEIVEAFQKLAANDNSETIQPSLF